jgi:hypothetical protein
MTVLSLLKNRSGASWLFLVAATADNAGGYASAGLTPQQLAAFLAIAAVKVRLVGLDFMELRHAPIPLRAAFEVYCVGIWALLSALYLWL